MIDIISCLMIIFKVYMNNVILKYSFFFISAPSKPKFLDRFFTNVGLSRKLHGRTRNGLVIQTVTTGSADSETSEEDLTFTQECKLLGTVSEPQTEVSSPCEELPPKTTQSTPNSPKLSGIVRRRLLEYQQIGTGSCATRLRSTSTPSSPAYKRRGFVYGNHQSPSNSKGEDSSSLSVLCSGLSRNEQFRQTVMSKGYVKALVDQIDGHHGKNDEEKSKEPPKTEISESEDAKEKNILEIPNVKPSDIAKSQNSPRLSKKDVERLGRSSPSSQKKLPLQSPQSNQSNSSSGHNSPVISPTPQKHVFNSDRCSSSSHKSSSSENELVTSSPRSSRKHKETAPKESDELYTNVAVGEIGSKSDISNSVKSLSSGCYSNGVSSVGQEEEGGNVQPEEGKREGEGKETKLGLDPAKLFDSSWSDSDVGSFSDFDSDLEEPVEQEVEVIKVIIY